MAKSPYVPMHPGWWPDIAAGLAKPWPQEAVWMDLRWWRDQEQRGREDSSGKPVKRPGRPTLGKRWGWTDTAVKVVLRAESVWRDPYKTANQDATSEQPGADQDSTSERPENEPQGSDIHSATTSEQPGADQDSTSERPERRPARDLYNRSTVHRAPSTVHAPLSPTLSPPGQQEEPDNGPGADRDLHHWREFNPGSRPRRDRGVNLTALAQQADRTPRRTTDSSGRRIPPDLVAANGGVFEFQDGGWWEIFEVGGKTRRTKVFSQLAAQEGP